MLLAALSFFVASAQAPVELDFEMVSNHIYVPADVNGHKTFAVLDTGAGSSVLDLALAEEWKLASSGTIQAGGIGKDQVRGKLLTGAKITIAGISQPMPIAIPLASLTTAEGRPLSSIVGYQFFSSHVVTIDYAKRRLSIFEPGAQIKMKGTVVPIRIVMGHPHISTELTIGGKTYMLEALIDTGASGGGLTAKFLKQHPLTVSTTAKGVIGGGVGGSIEGRFFRPDSIKLGDTTLGKPVMTLNDSSGGASGETSAYDILIGADLLKRFRVTFDYPHSRMIFEPADEIAKPFEADKTGLRVFAEGADLRTFKIVSVLDGSSASAAGLKVGDVIETIDDGPASRLSLQELRDRFRAADAKGWDFGIRRSGELLKVRVEAKSII